MDSDDEPVKRTQSTGNIFEDLGFDVGEAAQLSTLSELIHHATFYVQDNGLTHAEAGRLLGFESKEISALMRGDIDEFTIDGLIVALARVGKRYSLTETG